MGRADRRLSSLRPSLPKHISAALTLAGYHRCCDLLGVGELELVDQLNITLAQVRALIKAIDRVVSPAPSTSLQLLEHRVGGRPATVMPTGFAPLDQHLHGGLPARTVCELVGPAGVGKTQLCLTVAMNALLSDDSRVVYVDTERSFSALRLAELLEKRLSYDDPHGMTRARNQSVEELMKRMIVLKPSSWADYTTCIFDQVETELLKPRAVSLLIIDSFASAVHWGFDSSTDTQRRQRLVAAHAARLKYYSDTYGLCVLVVNQVVPSGPGSAAFGTGFEAGDVGGVQGQDDHQLLAYLGTLWAHCVNVRLVLQYPALGDVPAAPLPSLPLAGIHVCALAPKPMRLRIAKSATCREASFDYVVSDTGIMPGWH